MKSFMEVSHDVDRFLSLNGDENFHRDDECNLDEIEGQASRNGFNNLSPQIEASNQKGNIYDEEEASIPSDLKNESNPQFEIEESSPSNDLFNKSSHQAEASHENFTSRNQGDKTISSNHYDITSFDAQTDEESFIPKSNFVHQLDPSFGTFVPHPVEVQGFIDSNMQNEISHTFQNAEGVTDSVFNTQITKRKNISGEPSEERKDEFDASNPSMSRLSDKSKKISKNDKSGSGSKDLNTSESTDRRKKKCLNGLSQDKEFYSNEHYVHSLLSIHVEEDKDEVAIHIKEYSMKNFKKKGDDIVIADQNDIKNQKIYPAQTKIGREKIYADEGHEKNKSNRGKAYEKLKIFLDDKKALEDAIAKKHEKITEIYKNLSPEDTKKKENNLKNQKNFFWKTRDYWKALYAGYKVDKISIDDQNT